MSRSTHGTKHRMFPTLAGYRSEWVIRDVFAGLAAGAVVIPQAIAYATIADLPPQVGLYTCIVPLFVYALLGGSRAMSVSTTSTVATLTATTLVTASLASSSAEPIGTLMGLSLLVGSVLLVARILRLSSLVENISAATVLGVKIGVGGTVAISQVPKLLGEASPASGEGFIHAVLAVVHDAPTVNWPTVALSAASILALLLLAKWPRVPATLIVFLAGILLVWLVGIDDAGIALVDPVPSGLPLPAFPDLSRVPELLPGALAIAVMVFLESATVARSIRRATEPRIDADQELLAIGAANVVSAFFPVLPAAGGFSQSAVNQNAGARTQLSSLVTVALAVLTALFLGPVLSQLPQATLAAMVLVAVVGLIDVPLLLRWLRISPLDFWIALLVAVIGLTAGLLAAVAAGIAATLFLVLREINAPRLELVGTHDAVIAVQVVHGLYAANALAHETAIVDLATTHPGPVRALVLDAHRLDIISMTVIEMLTDLDRELAARDITLCVAALPERAAAVAGKTEWFQSMVSTGRVYATVESALSR